MFEECFSMIELNALVEAMPPMDMSAEAELEFDQLTFMLLSALDDALSNFDETSAASVH